MRRKPDMEDRIFSKLGLIILILILCTCQLLADAISIENVPYIHQVLDFPKSYPEAKVFRLETNYRSTPEILDLANDSQMEPATRSSHQTH